MNYRQDAGNYGKSVSAAWEKIVEEMATIDELLAAGLIEITKGPGGEDCYRVTMKGNLTLALLDDPRVGPADVTEKGWTLLEGDDDDDTGAA